MSQLADLKSHMDSIREIHDNEINGMRSDINELREINKNITNSQSIMYCMLCFCIVVIISSNYGAI